MADAVGDAHALNHEYIGTEQGANAIEFFAVGTAVVPTAEKAQIRPLDNVQQVVTFDR